MLNQQKLKCCNDPHLHKGWVWGIKFLPVECCCHCETVEARFGIFGEVIIFLVDFLNLSDEEYFAIELEKE